MYLRTTELPACPVIHPIVILIVASLLYICSNSNKNSAAKNTHVKMTTNVNIYNVVFGCSLTLSAYTMQSLRDRALSSFWQSFWVDLNDHFIISCLFISMFFAFLLFLPNIGKCDRISSFPLIWVFVVAAAVKRKVWFFCQKRKTEKRCS